MRWSCLSFQRQLFFLTFIARSRRVFYLFPPTVFWMVCAMMNVIITPKTSHIQSISIFRNLSMFYVAQHQDRDKTRTCSKPESCVSILHKIAQLYLPSKGRFYLKNRKIIRLNFYKIDRTAKIMLIFSGKQGSCWVSWVVEWSSKLSQLRDWVR